MFLDCHNRRLIKRMKRKTCAALLILSAAMMTACGNSSEVSNNSESTSKSANVELCEYKNVETGLSVQEVTDEDINKIIDDTVKQAGGNFAETEAPAQSGYRVDVTASQDGSDPFEMSFEIGDENYPAEFSEVLTGLSKGESASATLSEESGGGTYEMTITQVYAPADITDDFVTSLGIENISTVNELKDDVTKYLEKQYIDTYNAELEEKVFEIVNDGSTVDVIPNNLLAAYKKIVNDNVDSLIASYQAQAEEGTEVSKTDVLSSQMKEDEFVGTVDDYIEWYAEKNAKQYLVAKKIADDEKLEISDDEVYSLAATEWAALGDEYATLKDYLDEYGIEQYERAYTVTLVKKFLAENSKEGYVQNETDEKETTDNSSEDASASASSSATE